MSKANTMIILHIASVMAGMLGVSWGAMLLYYLVSGGAG
jgi:hypothetical protein